MKEVSIELYQNSITLHTDQLKLITTAAYTMIFVQQTKKKDRILGTRSEISSMILASENYLNSLRILIANIERFLEKYHDLQPLSSTAIVLPRSKNRKYKS